MNCVIDQLWDSAARGRVFLDVRPEFDYLCLHVRFTKEMMPLWFCTLPICTSLNKFGPFFDNKRFFFPSDLGERKIELEIYVNSLLNRNVLSLD